MDVYNDSGRCMAYFDSKRGKALDVVFLLMGGGIFGKNKLCDAGAALEIGVV